MVKVKVMKRQKEEFLRNERIIEQENEGQQNELIKNGVTESDKA